MSDLMHEPETMPGETMPSQQEGVMNAFAEPTDMSDESGNEPDEIESPEQGFEGNEDSAPEVEPASQKLYAGKFSNAEDLERDYHRKGQKVNELERRLVEMESMLQGNNVAPLQHKPTSQYDAILAEEFAIQKQILQATMGDFAEEEAIDRGAYLMAQANARRQQQTLDMITIQKVQNNPEYQKIQQLIQEKPHLRGIEKNPQMTNFVLDILNSSVVKPAQPKSMPAKFDKNKQARIGGNSPQRKEAVTFPKLTQREVNKYRNEWGLNDEQIKRISDGR